MKHRLKTTITNIRRRHYRALTLIFSFAMVATLAFLATSSLKQTDAASLASFKPGNIINNFTMSNYQSMTENQIQLFLKSKNSCNDTNIAKAANYPNLSYHIVNGHFVCMADETFDGETAAHIIWQAAQDYKINPQVLIVLLQKEQGLVTDTWPNNIQYRSATGYGCPDTAACASKYYGFKNQVRNAAALFRTVLDGGWSNFTVGNNYIQYNPNSGCGGSTVYIENLATASLYRYTPYQPNQAALNAGYGTGNSCSAYGNRNFYLYFTDWFGSTQTAGTVPVTIKVLGVSEISGYVKYTAHVSNVGWQNAVADGSLSGTTGRALQMEAIQIALSSDISGSVQYKMHLSNIGWESKFVADGTTSGTTGQNRQAEAIQIQLTGSIAASHDIYYRAHVQDVGWMTWAKNGESAGSEGYARQLEAVEIILVRKNSDGTSKAPSYSSTTQPKTTVAFMKKTK